MNELCSSGMAFAFAQHPYTIDEMPRQYFIRDHGDPDKDSPKNDIHCPYCGSDVFVTKFRVTSTAYTL